MGYTRKSVGIGALGGILIAIAIISSVNTYFTYGTGKLVISIKDPPQWMDATHVYIKCSKMEIHREDGNESGWITIFQNLGWINLAEILNSSKMLGEAELQAGKYNIIRFYISDALVTVNGENMTAEVLSGKLQIVITHGGITINAGQASKLLIDIETRVTYTPRGYKIHPNLKSALPLGDQ